MGKLADCWKFIFFVMKNVFFCVIFSLILEHYTENNFLMERWRYKFYLSSFVEIGWVILVIFHLGPAIYIYRPLHGLFPSDREDGFDPDSPRGPDYTGQQKIIFF